MKTYETVLVLTAEGGENQIKDDLKKLEGIFTSRGAKAIAVDRWGTKPLGYRMRGQAVGHYAAIRFECENTAVPNDVGSVLRITEAVLKFQTHATGLPKRKFKGRAKTGGFAAALDDGEDVEL